MDFSKNLVGAALGMDLSPETSDRREIADGKTVLCLISRTDCEVFGLHLLGTTRQGPLPND
jgi:hypothetical protein